MKKKYILLYSAIIICAVALVLLYVFPVKTDDIELNALLNGILTRLVLATGLGTVMACEYKKLLAFPKISKSGAVCVLVCMLVPVANFPYSALASGQAEITRPDLLWLFLAECLLVGIVEEWLFRGLLLDLIEGAFKKDKYGVWYTVILSAAAFGLFHVVNLIEGAALPAVALQVGYSFLIGCMLATVFLKTRNLWACILLHALFDVGGLIVSSIGRGSPHDTIFWILTAVCGVIAAAQVIYTVYKMFKEQNEEKPG